MSQGDNVLVTQGAGTSMATNKVANVHYPRSKIVWGQDGVVNDASQAAPIPVAVYPGGASTPRRNYDENAGSLTPVTVVSVSLSVGKYYRNLAWSIG